MKTATTLVLLAVAMCALSEYPTVSAARTIEQKLLEKLQIVKRQAYEEEWDVEPAEPTEEPANNQGNEYGENVENEEERCKRQIETEPKEMPTEEEKEVIQSELVKREIYANNEEDEQTEPLDDDPVVMEDVDDNSEDDNSETRGDQEGDQSRRWIRGYNMRVFLSLSALLLTTSAFPSNLTVRLTRQAYANKAWPNALIPIGYKTNYPEAWKASVRAGIKAWQDRTCVRFRDNDVTSKDRVEVYDGGQCSSSVGREGGKQYCSLGRDCQGLGSATHELGHAIGLHHMQVRPDRDQYITVQKFNINPAAFNVNFAIDHMTTSLGFPYDFSSILHYGPFHFAKEGAPGMIPRDSRFRFSMGGIYPSFYDVMRVNKMYNCDAKCASSRTTCVNNGVPDVNNCAQCFCPVGYGGKDCSGVPAGSTVLTATATEQRFETKVVGGKKDMEYDLKHLVINAPAGKKVIVKATYFWVPYDITCTYGAIEFYTKTDTRGGAPRVCKKEWLEPSYTSEGSRMYIRMFNRGADPSTFQLTYKAV